MKRLFFLHKDHIRKMEAHHRQLMAELDAASQFIHHIKSGNLEADYTGTLPDHPLAQALLSLRSQMASLQADEQQRSWTNEGLARFSELLRVHQHEELKDLLSKVTDQLVKYMQANQGGIFVLNDTDTAHPVLELVSCYAYERKKYIHRQLEIGEGLVGQCFLEKETIHLIDVPENYVRITSGLGEALPRCILIIPLKLNNEVLGVMELASFQKMLPHQISFAEKIGVSIASSYASLRISNTTSQLLKESQLQAEQLRAQEEEMRQNMEEMQSTQEELKRIQMESEAQTNIINSVAIVSKTDLRGNITYVNEEFIRWSKYGREEVMGKNHRILKSGHQEDSIFADLWKTISDGRIWRGEVKNRAKDGTYYWVDAIIAPVLDERGKPKEYIAQRFVINEKKLQEEKTSVLLEESRAKEEELRQNMEEMQAIQEDMERTRSQIEAQMKIINKVAIVSKTDLRGNITDVNEEFTRWSKYTREEVIGKNHRILKSGHQEDAIFADLWSTISSGGIWRGKVKNRAKDGTYYWVDAIIAPVLDEQGKPKEYIAQRFVLAEA